MDELSQITDELEEKSMRQFGGHTFTDIDDIEMTSYINTEKAYR